MPETHCTDTDAREIVTYMAAQVKKHGPHPVTIGHIWKQATLRGAVRKGVIRRATSNETYHLTAWGKELAQRCA